MRMALLWLAVRCCVMPAVCRRLFIFVVVGCCPSLLCVVVKGLVGCCMMRLLVVRCCLLFVVRSCLVLFVVG